MTADEIEMDNRMSTAGYLPTSPSNMSTPSGYVPCQEKHIYPALNYPDGEGASTSADDIAIISTKDQTVSQSESQIQRPQNHKYDKPNDYIELTIIACIFNFLFGIVAMTLSFRSQENWKQGHRSRAKCYGLFSMVMSVFAIVTSAIIVFVVVWLFVLGGAASI